MGIPLKVTGGNFTPMKKLRDTHCGHMLLLGIGFLRPLESRRKADKSPDYQGLVSVQPVVNVASQYIREKQEMSVPASSSSLWRGPCFRLFRAGRLC